MPESFKEILLSLANANAVCQCDIVETNVPTKSAPYAVALEGHIGDVASGRFTVLYNPAKKDVWGSAIRIVTFIETDHSEKGEQDAEYDAEYVQNIWKYYNNDLIKGSAFQVSANISTSQDYYFGDGMGGPNSELINETQKSFEMRVSWSVKSTDILPQIKVWDKMMHRSAGLKYLAHSKLGTMS